MSYLSIKEDRFRDFLHAELDRLLDQAPDFGYVEFHIAFKNKLPINVDVHINQALRIWSLEEGISQRSGNAQSKGTGYGIGRK